MGTFWRLEAAERTIEPVTSMAEKSGSPGVYNLAVGACSLVFSWE